MAGEIRRIGPFLEMTDSEGLRHLFRPGANIEVSDTDCLRNECLINVGSRSFMVLRPYDEVVAALVDASAPCPRDDVARPRDRQARRDEVKP